MVRITFLVLLCGYLHAGNCQEARLYRQNDKVGLLNTQNKPITQAIYDHIVPGVPYSVVKKYEPATARYVTGCVDATGKLVIPMAYTDLKMEGLRIIACQKNQHGFVYGVLSLQNEVIIPLQYKSIKVLGTLRFAVENLEGKIALFSENGSALTAFVIDKLYPFNNSVCVFEQEGLVGLLDRDGTIKTTAAYRDIVAQADGTYRCIKPNTWQWIDARNNVLHSVQADSIIFQSAENVTIINRKGHTLADKNLHPIGNYYQQILSTVQPMLFLVRNQKVGVIRENGDVLLPVQYDSVFVSLQYIYAKAGQRWKIFSHSGKAIADRLYDQVTEDDSFIHVKKNGYWGALNHQGRETLACVYDTILGSSENQFSVRFKGKYGIVSREEHWLVPMQEHPLQLISDQHYLVKDGALLTLKDFSHRVIYFTNNALTRTTDGFIEKTSAGEVWHISWKGVVTKIQQVPVGEVASVEKEYEGYRAIFKNGKWGFVDAQGRLRIPNRYEKVKHFSEGLAPFMLRNRWGFLNKEDEIIFNPAYDDAEPFENGLSLVKQKGLYGFIDKQNQLVLPCRYESIKKHESGFYILKNKELYGLADKTGNLIYEPKYTWQQITPTDINVGRNNQFGVLDFSGLSIIPIMYDYLKPTGPGTFLTFKKGEVTTITL